MVLPSVKDYQIHYCFCFPKAGGFITKASGFSTNIGYGLRKDQKNHGTCCILLYYKKNAINENGKNCHNRFVEEGCTPKSTPPWSSITYVSSKQTGNYQRSVC